MKKINIFGFEKLKLKNLLSFFIIDNVCVNQIMFWIHKNGVNNFKLMSNISKIIRYKLFNLLIVKLPIIEKEEISFDGTIKWLFKVSKDNYIECVYMSKKEKGTLCLSSQVGCSLNCSFCNTGMHGFNRNLYSSEIIGQLYVVKKRLKFLFVNCLIFFNIRFVLVFILFAII